MMNVNLATNATSHQSKVQPMRTVSSPWQSQSLMFAGALRTCACPFIGNLYIVKQTPQRSGLRLTTCSQGIAQML